MRVLKKAIAEADSLQEVSRLEDALQRGVLPDDLLHQVGAPAHGVGGVSGNAGVMSFLTMTKAAPPAPSTEFGGRPAFPPQPAFPAQSSFPPQPVFPPQPTAAPGELQLPAAPSAAPPGHAVSHALLNCMPAEVRCRSLQMMGGGLPPQLPQASALGHCLAARGQGWPDVGAVGGEEHLAMPDISALRTLSRALVATARTSPAGMAAGGDPFSQFLAEIGPEGGAILRSHPPDAVASTISAGRLFAAEPQKALVARLRRAAGETGAAAVATGSSAELAASTFCERNWVSREVETRLLGASAMAQCAVVAEGPLLGGSPTEQLAGRLLRVEAMTPGASAS